MTRLLACIGFLILAPAAWAHDMWIVPPGSPSAAGEVVEVRLRLGHAGAEEQVARDARRIVRFTAAGPQVEVPVAGLDGAAIAYFRPPEPGLWALAYESTAAYSELPGAAFTAYLEEEGLDGALRLRREQGEEAAPGRELYSRSLKSLVTVGATGRSEGDGRVGLPLELVAETLAAAGTGAPTRLRLFLHGEPLSGALVDVRRLDQAEPAAAGRTDGEGRISFRLGPGSWVAATVHMAASSSAQADWRSIFSTLTFVVAE